MKLIKVADRIERYIDPSLLDEYRTLKSEYSVLSDEYVELFNEGNLDPGDIRWVNNRERIKRKMDELKQKLSVIRDPARVKIDEDKQKQRIRREEQEAKTKEIYERAENDTSFQITIENAVEDWPRTDNPRLAGYIMQDGSMLNFSYQGYQRDMDHREVTGEIEELDGGTDGMRQFQLATGAVRLHAQGNGYVSFDWETDPSRSQQRKMVEIAEGNSEIYVRDFQDEKTYNDVWEMQEDLGWY
jgi:hypothetical protein